MNFERMQISPSKANELLKNNPMNRRLDMSIIQQYAEIMKAGDWNEESPEPIAFDLNGNLLNGQHRLSAIVLSGVTLKLWVAKGVPKETFTIIDQGKKRTTGDAMTITGIPNANQVAAIIKAYLRVKNNKVGHNAGDAKNKIYTKHIIDIYKKHPQYWDKITTDSISFAKEFSRVVAVSFIGGYYAAMCDIQGADAVHFMEKLSTGVGVNSLKDPIGVLRKYYIDEKTAHKKHSTEFNNAVMRIAWNAFREKRTITISNFNYNKNSPIPKLL